MKITLATVLAFSALASCVPMPAEIVSARSIGRREADAKAIEARDPMLYIVYSELEDGSDSTTEKRSVNGKRAVKLSERDPMLYIVYSELEDAPAEESK